MLLIALAVSAAACGNVRMEYHTVLSRRAVTMATLAVTVVNDTPYELTVSERTAGALKDDLIPPGDNLIRPGAEKTFPLSGSPGTQIRLIATARTHGSFWSRRGAGWARKHTSIPPRDTTLRWAIAKNDLLSEYDPEFKCYFVLCR